MWKLNGYIFLIKHDDLLSKYNAIWDKISTDAKIDLNSKPVYKNVYGDKARDFHNKEVPKVDSSCTCFAFISLDSIFEVKLLSPSAFKRMQVHWKKMNRYITDDLENSSDDLNNKNIKARIRKFKTVILREQFRKCIFEGAILKL